MAADGIHASGDGKWLGICGEMAADVKLTERLITLGADELSDIMLSAQEAAYGDGLAEDERHPYMWVCKGHYYSGGLSFYNFPYAFGGLCARGLYARYKHDGAEFMKTYKKMLTYTSVADVEDAARVAGIDLTSRDFWREGLETIAKKIDQFCEIVK